MIFHIRDLVLFLTISLFLFSFFLFLSLIIISIHHLIKIFFLGIVEGIIVLLNLSRNESISVGLRHVLIRSILILIILIEILSLTVHKKIRVIHLTWIYLSSLVIIIKLLWVLLINYWSLILLTLSLKVVYKISLKIDIWLIKVTVNKPVGYILLIIINVCWSIIILMTLLILKIWILLVVSKLRKLIKLFSLLKIVLITISKKLIKWILSLMELRIILNIWSHMNIVLKLIVKSMCLIIFGNLLSTLFFHFFIFFLLLLWFFGVLRNVLKIRAILRHFLAWIFLLFSTGKFFKFFWIFEYRLGVEIKIIIIKG